MNHKELITKLSSDLNLPKNEVELLLEAFVSTSTDLLCESKIIGIQGFGNFETRKKIVVYLHKKKIFVPLQSCLRIEIVASVAELVDALDSKSSEVTLVPVRFRPDVQIIKRTLILESFSLIRK